MGCIRPATPGFIVTLVATALLAVVVFCVPYFRSIYFLRANISVSGYNGSITFGTLGYCLELTNGTTCSTPSIGYQLDINALVGNKLPVEIPQVAVKWITYALVLHIVALAAAGISAIFGLLAHVREMSMACCSTFISGFAAFIAMLAFIFDLILFFVAKARINAVGEAQIGNAIWLTLAAWLLLFFSGCFFTIGRCCISKRGPSSGGGAGGGDKWTPKHDTEAHAPSGKLGGAFGAFGGRHKRNASEQLRLDAVKAEVDRKAAQKRQEEVGLPAFYETVPLTARVDGDHVYLDGDNESQLNLPAAAAPPGRKPSGNVRVHGQGYAAGYVPGQAGQRAVDEFYNQPQPPQPTSHVVAGHGYPPQRQPSGYTPQSSPPPGGYGAYGAGGRMTTSPPPSRETLAVPGAQYSDPYGQGGAQYGHTAGGSSYHTAHGQQASGYSAYDPYSQAQDPSAYQPQLQQPQPHSVFSPPPAMPDATSYGASAATPNPYISSPPQQQPHTQERSYTLGGDGYGYGQQQQQQHDYSSNPYIGGSTSPPQRQYTTSPQQQYASPPQQYSDPRYPPALDTGAGQYDSHYATQQQQQPTSPTSPVRGPRPPPGRQQTGMSEEAPPGYDTGTAGVTGNWGKQGGR